MKLNSKIILAIFAVLITTAPAAANNCGMSSNGLTIQDSSISEGEYTTVSVRVNNGADETRTIRFKLNADGERKATRKKHIGPGESKKFEATVSSDDDLNKDGEIQIHVETYAECAYDEEFKDKITVNYNKDDHNDNNDENQKPRAKIKVSPDPSDQNGRIKFDATESYDSDGTIEKYYFDFDNDGVYDRSSTSGIVYKRFDTSGTKTVKLKVEDNGGERDTTTRSFSVEYGYNSCDITSGLLRLSDRSIQEGESTNARVNVYNEGEPQEVRVTFKKNDVTVSETTKTLLEDETGRFSASISPEENSEVRVFVDLVDGPCGSQELYQSSRNVYVSSLPEPASLKVITVDRDGNRISDARIAVNNGDDALKFTNGDGVAQFNLGPGGYSIEATKDRYTTANENIRLRSGEARTVRLIMADRDQESSLTVRAEDEDGDPVNNAKVTIQNGERQVKYTDSDGEIGFSVEPDNYEVTVQKSGFEIQQRDTEVNPGQNKRVLFELQGSERRDDEDAQLEVCVRDEDYDDVRDARVQVENGDSQSSYTANDGCTEFSLEPDNYDITASKSDFTTSTQTINLEAGDSRRRVLTIQRTGSDRANLNVNVEDENGNKIRDARVEIENGDREVKRTDYSGETEFRNLDPDRYDIEVSKTGYLSETDSVRLYRGETETITVTLRERNTGNHDARLRVLVEDQDGNNIRNARVRVENSETDIDFTDNNGESIFYLEPDTYDIRITNSGYRAQDRTVTLGSGERETLRFRLQPRDNSDRRSFNVEQVSFTSTVCKGENLNLNIRIENGNNAQNVAVGVRGLGDQSIERRSLDSGETRNYELTLQNVQGSGNEQIRIAVINGREHVEIRNVKVLNCSNDNGQDDTQQPEGITLDLTERVQVGDSFRVSGYVDGVRGPTQIRILVDGEKRATVTTEPDGFYQTYLEAEEVGRNTVETRSGGLSASQEINVLPTVSVTSMESPEKVFENDEMEICANVESQVTPLVVIQRDGEKVGSKNQKGDVCFDIEAGEVGEHEYTIIASARGIQSSKTRIIETLELDNEVENFPDKVAMVRSDGGIIRVSLYNINDETRKYDVDLSGLRSDWVASTEKSVYVSSGERKNVYFYITPEAEGDFRPLLEVSSDQEGIIYSQEILVNSGGTTKSSKTWFRRLKQLLNFN